MSDGPTHHPGGTYPLAGRAVGRVGYGAMQLGRPLDADRRSDAIALLRRVRELGINHIDTAGFYTAGAVNEVIRDALAPYPDELVIVSKVGAATGSPGGPALVPAQRPAELRASVESDLRSLGTERVDIVNLRRVDRAPGIVAQGEQIVPLEDQLAELVALREEGKLGAIGLSHVDAGQLRAALPAGIACVQNLYSLVAREDEALLDRCREHDIAWVPFFPLGGAFPGRRKVVEEPVVVAIAQRLGATPAAVGLAWLLAHAPNVLLIPGTSDPDHLAANLACGELELPAEAIAELDALGSQ